MYKISTVGTAQGRYVMVQFLAYIANQHWSEWYTLPAILLD